MRRKIHFGGMISKPITFPASAHFSEFENELAAKQYPFTSFPVVDEKGLFLGLIVRDQLDFVGDNNPTLDEIMLPLSRIVTAPPNTPSNEVTLLTLITMFTLIILTSLMGIAHVIY